MLIVTEGIDPAEYVLDTETVAKRLNVSVSTLNAWLRKDEARPPERQAFQEFHRSRGRYRFWSEESFRLLEIAIHRESQPGGVLAAWRNRRRDIDRSPPDPDAEAALEEVLHRPPPRMR
jgi:hypothetical protein